MISKRLTSTLVSLALTVGMIPVAVSADGGNVAINEKNFPDKLFRDYVSEEFDIDEDGVLSAEEIADVTKIDMLGVYDLKSIEGVKNFTSLSYLCAAVTNVTSADLSGMSSLIEVDFDLCDNFKSINLSGCTGIEKINLWECPITSLDISACSNLTKLNITGCSYLDCSLDLSKFPKLEFADVSRCDLTSLNVSGLKELKLLFCEGNNFKSIDITTCPILMKIYSNHPDIRPIEWSRSDFEHNGETIKVLQYSDSEIDRENIEDYESGAFFVDATVSINGNPPAIVTPTPTPSSTPIPSSDPTPTSKPTTTDAPDVDDFVDRCYGVALGREPDAEGKEEWTDELNEGEACGAQVGYGFIFSPEYIAKNTDNEQFTKDLYSLFFGREPDENGFNYWVAQLNAGVSREEIFAGFANSEEFYNLCAEYGVVSGFYVVGVPNGQQGGVNCFVSRLYRVCLNRLPDMGGQSGWVKKLIEGEVSGTTVAHGFIFSPEFIELNLSNTDFIEYMYSAFFGREASQKDIDDWVAQLTSGSIDREGVFNGFAGSIEFDALCNSYGITR